MCKAAAPLDLLRDLRKVFVFDAFNHRKREKLALSQLEAREAAAKAYACESVVRTIDDTLRDWG
jgi:hypothetical protein